MKKRKLIGLASLLLALGVVGCGDEGSTTTDDGGKGGGGDVCEHDYVLTNISEKQHQEICSKCGDKKTAKNHSFSKDPDKASENKAATCTEDGWEYKKCKCGATKKDEIKALGHSYTVIASTTAKCEEAGVNTMKCSRCESISEETQPQEALGHQWVADTSYVGLAASCTGPGTAQEKCSRDGCNATRIVETAPLGHAYVDVAGEDTYETTNVAALTTGTCSRDACDGKRVYWNALQLTTNCKTNKRLGRAAVEDDPATEDVNEAKEAFYEPNYVEEGEGIRFWGRPIHNAMTLSDEGKSSSSDHVSVYDAEVTGSFFEYNINLAAAMTDVKFVADMAPTADLGTGDLYKANSGDWTPGLIDSTSNLYSHRFVVTLDGVELTFDDSNNACPGSDRGWFTFPINKFDVPAGPHTIRIAMAGGYLSTFYGFGLEKVVGAAHEHDFVKDTTLSKNATCTEDGRFYGVCSCGLVKDEVLTKLGHDLVDVDAEGNKAATCLTAGVQHKECSRCDYEEDAVVPALGHDYEEKGKVEEEGFATVTKYECKSADSKRVLFNAKDVNTATKTSTRSTGSEEGGDLFAEPNYVENSNGSVSFWGRPIHNNQPLNAQGSATQRPGDLNELYDETVQGSFVEYDFKLDEAIKGNLISDLQPGSYMNGKGMFTNDSGDWTPGLKKEADVVSDMDTRYVITVDGTVLAQDLTKDVPENGRGVYTFPLAEELELAAGPHKIRFTMAGGYRASFYTFGIQTADEEVEIIDPVHEHNFVAGDKAADSDLRVAACSCGEKFGYELQAADCTGETAPDPATAGTRLGKNNKDDVWEINGIKAGVYEVYINAQTQTNNQNNYWNAGDDVANGGTSGNNGGAQANDIAYRYNITTGADAESYKAAVDVGVAGKKYSETGIDNTAAKWSNVPVATIVIDEGATLLKLHGNNNGYAIFVFGLRLVEHNHEWAAGEAVTGSALKTITCDCNMTAYELAAADVTEGQNAPVAGSSNDAKNTRLGKGGKLDDVWNITGIAAGKYEVYLNAQCSAGNMNKGYWNSATAVTNGDSVANNGNSDALAAEYKYKVKVGDGEYVNLGNDVDTYAATGLNESSANWTNKALATIDVAEGATTITVHNMNNGYAIWVFAVRLVKVA